jgi:hypothetical protein
MLSTPEGFLQAEGLVTCLPNGRPDWETAYQRGVIDEAKARAHGVFEA